MRRWILIAGSFAVVLAAWISWFGRYTTNTAGGRFYKNDRWTGETIVVEKNGYTHLLAVSGTNKRTAQSKLPGPNN